MSETTTEVNVVTLSNGSKSVSIRITKHADSRIVAEVSRSIAWKPIGGRRAAMNEMDRLRGEGYKVVAAA